jgi:hypothetical protein
MQVARIGCGQVFVDLWKKTAKYAVRINLPATSIFFNIISPTSPETAIRCGLGCGLLRVRISCGPSSLKCHDADTTISDIRGVVEHLCCNTYGRVFH